MINQLPLRKTQRNLIHIKKQKNVGIGDERSFPQIISVHFTLTTKESTIPSRGVNQCMKSSCKRKNKFIAFAGGSWLALNKELKQHRRATATKTSLEK